MPNPNCVLKVLCFKKFVCNNWIAEGNTFGAGTGEYRTLKSHIELLISCHFGTP